MCRCSRCFTWASSQHRRWNVQKLHHNDLVAPNHTNIYCKWALRMTPNNVKYNPNIWNYEKNKKWQSTWDFPKEKTGIVLGMFETKCFLYVWDCLRPFTTIKECYNSQKNLAIFWWFMIEKLKNDLATFYKHRAPKCCCGCSARARANAALQ